MVISKEDRLQLQLLNAVLDRAEMSVSQSETKMENAKLAFIIARKELDSAKKGLAKYSTYLSDTYEIDFEKDKVDWETGEISREGGEETSQEG